MFTNYVCVSNTATLNDAHTMSSFLLFISRGQPNLRSLLLLGNKRNRSEALTL